jgi:hypothetical protein
LKQLAEALKITAELTVQEWNDFGLAVTRMVDVHVNRQEGEGGGEGDGEGERGGKYTDNQQERVSERERERSYLTINREEEARVGGRLRARKEERWRMRFDMHTTYAHEHWQSQAHSHTVRARDGRIVGRYYRHCPGLERSMLPMTCDNLDGA